jgi:hypothetical protein
MRGMADDASNEDFREFARELILRFERFSNDMRAEFRAQREESRVYFEKVWAEHDEQRERLDEILAEGRASRQALFKLLDRLDNGGGSATA